MKPSYAATELRLVRDKVQEVTPRSGSDARALALVRTKIDEALLWLGTVTSADAGETQETRRQPGLDPEAD